MCVHPASQLRELMLFPACSAPASAFRWVQGSPLRPWMFPRWPLEACGVQTTLPEPGLPRVCVFTPLPQVSSPGRKAWPVCDPTWLCPPVGWQLDLLVRILCKRLLWSFLCDRISFSRFFQNCRMLELEGTPSLLKQSIYRNALRPWEGLCGVGD